MQLGSRSSLFRRGSVRFVVVRFAVRRGSRLNVSHLLASQCQHALDASCGFPDADAV